MKPSALRIERLLAKVEAELACSARAAHHECAGHPKEHSQCSSVGSAPAGPHRFAAGRRESEISIANSGESRLDASAQGSRAG